MASPIGKKDEILGQKKPLQDISTLPDSHKVQPSREHISPVVVTHPTSDSLELAHEYQRRFPSNGRVSATRWGRIPALRSTPSKDTPSPIQSTKTIALQHRPEKYAVLLIDAVTLEPNRTTNLAEERHNMAQVLQRANALNIPVYVTEYGLRTDPQLMRYFQFSNWKIILKDSISAFKGTGLEGELKKAGVTNLILMGFEQTACVYHTAKDAVLLGYDVYTSYDVVQELKRDSPNAATENKTVTDFLTRNTHLVESFLEFPIFEQ